ncbi:MAG: two-component regulator propeller domain-containing protein, partial [Rhodothermales bacterium]
MHGLCAILLLAALSASASAQPAPGERSTDAPVDRSAPSAAAPRSLTQYVHRAWTTEDGLPYNAVWTITQTRDGYLWVGTMGGLARFDGARFVTFTTRNTDALPNNGISALYEDAEGTLWVGTLGGLARYRDGHFTTFTTDDGLLTNDVRAVSLSEDGALWFGTYGGGAHRWADGRIEAYSLVGVPSGPWVHRLLAGRDGAVWVGVGQGQADRSPYQLLRLEGGRYRSPAPEHVLYSVRALHEDRDGSLWIGTYGGGLARYDDGVLQPFTSADGLTDDRVQALYEDRDGNLWAGTMGGLDLLRRASPFTTYATEEGLPNDNVRGVTQGASGAIWIATAEGLARLDADGITAFATHDGLPEPFVQSLWARQNGEIWLGGQNSVSRYADGAFTRYGLPEDWPDGVVRSIVEDPEGQLWLGSVGAGLIRFAPGGSHAYTVADGLAHNSVTVLLAGREGRLWVGTSRGLNLMAAGQIRRFDGEERFAEINVRSLYEDDEGTLWIGTYGRGLMRYQPAPAEAGGQVTVYTTREGLHDDGVWSILEDDHGFLWMSSNRGVFRVPKADLEAMAMGQRRTLTPVVYGVADGMKTAEANGASKPSGWRSRDGRMWFSTQRGVVVVDPDAAARAAPAPIVEGVQARGGQAERADGAVALPARARDFTVAYTSLSFADPERLRFRYRLDGFTDGWVEAEERREAVFTNVPAGRYAFRVAAQNGNGKWVEGESLALAVAPLFWETVWFHLLVALGLVGLVVLAVRAQGRRQRRREAALEALIDARTDELRRAKETTEAQALRLRELDALKSRFFANVSHEFRTPLTLTLGPLDDVLGGEHGAVLNPVREQLALARRNAGRVLDLINQILDVARLEAGRMRLRARRLDFGAFVASIAQALVPLAERKGITLDVQIPEAGTDVWADPEQLQKVFVNLLSNALKFTPEGGAVRVAVSVEDEAVRVDVRDNGPGIPAADLPHVFERFYRVGESAARMHPGTGIGLALAKELVDLHGGTIEVESEEGFGSRFIVTLRRGRDHFGPEEIVQDGEGGWEDGSLGVWEGRGDGAAEPEAEEVEAEDIDADVTTVLVVEDNAEVRAYIRRHLVPDYRVLEAADGEAGLALARERLPDLVLSDVMMPEMDGFALCRALKADPETGFIPVVLLTARAEQEDRLEGLREHCDDYLTKPFDVRELRARVDNLITSRRRLRERLAAAPPAAGDGVGGLHPSPVDVVSADAAFLERVR